MPSPSSTASRSPRPRLEVIRGAEFFEWDAGEAVRTYGRVIPSAPGVKLHRAPPADRAGGRVLAVELPDEPAGPQGGRRPGLGLLDHPEGGRGDPGRCASTSPRPSTTSACRRGCSTWCSGSRPTSRQYLIPSDTIRLVAFTGSTAVGRHLTVLASNHMTPVLMELGGHAPVIVCEDTDVEAAAVSPRRSGQDAQRRPGLHLADPVLRAPSSIFDQFLDIIHRAVGRHGGRRRHEPGVEMGPLANDRRHGRPVRVRRRRGRCRRRADTGGSRIDRPGYFFEPTMLANVPDHARVMQEEPFGPMAVVNPVDSLDEAIKQANSVPYGLAAYGFTNRADYVDRMIDEVEAGNLSINTLEASLPETPFGGVKSSGYGREGGSEGLHHYTVVKNLSHSDRHRLSEVRFRLWRTLSTASESTVRASQGISHEVHPQQRQGPCPRAHDGHLGRGPVAVRRAAPHRRRPLGEDIVCPAGEPALQRGPTDGFLRLPLNGEAQLPKKAKALGSLASLELVAEQGTPIQASRSDSKYGLGRVAPPIVDQVITGRAVEAVLDACIDGSKRIEHVLLGDSLGDRAHPRPPRHLRSLISMP